MFERYTERARQAIFFARYESSAAGCLHIEPRHVLLGALRADTALAKVAGIGAGVIDSLRKPCGPPCSQQRDLPLSDVSKRALAHGAEYAHKLNHQNIDTA